MKSHITTIVVSASVFGLMAVPALAAAQQATTTSFTVAAPAAKQTGPIFLANLVPGSSGPDVMRLQRYLNTHGCPLAQTGLGAYQQETSYFGPLTKGALQCFQTDTGLISPTGNLGVLSREYISTLP